jgi:hypothetical protein
MRTSGIDQGLAARIRIHSVLKFRPLSPIHLDSSRYHPIIPYPTEWCFRGGLFQALRARLRSVVLSGAVDVI